jgi:hypothetical protein
MKKQKTSDGLFSSGDYRTWFRVVGDVASGATPIGSLLRSGEHRPKSVDKCSRRRNTVVLEVVARASMS